MPGPIAESPRPSTDAPHSLLAEVSSRIGSAARSARLGPFEVADLAQLAFLPSLLYKAARLATGRKSDAGGDPGERDPDFVEEALSFIDPLLRYYFRAEVRGGEHLPAAGPGLVVGNHSGGLQTFESFVILREVLRRHGKHRALHGLGHDLVFDDPTFRKYAGRLGALRTGHASARRAFERGALALVYPGSEYDSFRPWSERNRVVLANRTGFIRLVLENGVPIVPVVTVGAQEAFYVLSRGEGVARALDLKRRFRSNVAPLALMLPWGIAPATIPYIPLPTKMVTQFGPPIRWSHLGPEAAQDPEIVRRCYDEVLGVMQGMLDGLAAERRFPILG